MRTEQRAQLFAALGDPTRLAIAEDLLVSDLSPGDLSERYDLPSNLLAHHLSVLEDAELITRSISAGDRRRRYLHINREILGTLGIGAVVPMRPVLFVCTHNSARSQLAAALWKSLVGSPATSAGTKPADRIHPRTIKAAQRAGLDLSAATPRKLDEVDVGPALVITVCDQAHEQIANSLAHWHWSTPDPVIDPTSQPFDKALDRLRKRITTLTGAANGQTIRSLPVRP